MEPQNQIDNISQDWIFEVYGTPASYMSIPSYIGLVK